MCVSRAPAGSIVHRQRRRLLAANKAASSSGAGAAASAASAAAAAAAAAAKKESKWLSKCSVLVAAETCRVRSDVKERSSLTAVTVQHKLESWLRHPDETAERFADAQTLVLEEASMVPQMHGCLLLERLPRSLPAPGQTLASLQNLTLVGDCNQLLSREPGSFFDDLTAWLRLVDPLAVCTLTQNFRVDAQAQALHRIVSGIAAGSVDAVLHELEHAPVAADGSRVCSLNTLEDNAVIDRFMSVHGVSPRGLLRSASSAAAAAAATWQEQLEAKQASRVPTRFDIGLFEKLRHRRTVSVRNKTVQRWNAEIMSRLGFADGVLYINQMLILKRRVDNGLVRLDPGDVFVVERLFDRPVTGRPSYAYRPTGRVLAAQGGGGADDSVDESGRWPADNERDVPHSQELLLKLAGRECWLTLRLVANAPEVTPSYTVRFGPRTATEALHPGYVTTVFTVQGGEYRRVSFVLENGIERRDIYTAFSRARTQLDIFYDPTYGYARNQARRKAGSRRGQSVLTPAEAVREAIGFQREPRVSAFARALRLCGADLLPSGD